MLEIQNVSKTFNAGTVNQKTATTEALSSLSRFASKPSVSTS